MSKCKIDTIRISVYDKTIVVAIGDFNAEAIAEHITNKKEASFFLKQSQQADLSGYDGFVFNTGSGNNVLWLQNAPKSEVDVNTLSHEAFHAAYDILKRVGVPLGDDSEEAYAYLIGYIVEQVVKIALTPVKDVKKVDPPFGAADL